MKNVILLGLLVSGLAAAQVQGSQTIRENNQTYRIDCSGANDVISVRGNGNVVTLTGICENLVIYGNGNTITAVSLRDIWLKGNGNVVTASLQTQAPRISNTGNDNRYSIGTAVSGTWSAARTDKHDDDQKDRDKKDKKDKDKGKGKDK